MRDVLEKFINQRAGGPDHGAMAASAIFFAGFFPLGTLVRKNVQKDGQTQPGMFL